MCECAGRGYTGAVWAGKCFGVNTQIFLSPLETTSARKPEFFKDGFCIKFQDYANEQTKTPAQHQSSEWVPKNPTQLLSCFQTWSFSLHTVPIFIKEMKHLEMCVFVLVKRSSAPSLSLL